MSLFLKMQTEQLEQQRGFEPGQLWQIEDGYVYITQLGPRHIYYKMLADPDQKAALTRTIGVEALLNFLQQSQGRLVGAEAR